MLTPIARQAFLLVAMEEFTLQDAALVLEISADEVNALIEKASQDIARQIATDVVIIEDEPLIALDLELLLQSLGHHVVRVARTERQAIDAVLQTRSRSRAGRHPAFTTRESQCSMPVDEILQTLPVPVIFVTASPERLLTGTKPEPTFLVRKPYHRDALKAVISQALFFDVRSAQAP